MTLTLLHVFLLTLAGAVLLPQARLRAMAVIGAIAVALAGAAFDIRLGLGPVAELAQRVATRGAPVTFLQINSGILLLGSALAFAAALGSLIVSRWRNPAAILAMGIELVALAGSLAGLFNLGSYVGWLPIVGIALLIGAVGFVVGLLGRTARAGSPFRRLDARLLERRPPHPIMIVYSTGDLIWFAGLLISAAVVLVAPTLRAVTLAIAVAAVTSHVLMRRSRAGTPIPVAPLLSLFLIPLLTYFTAIAGEPNPTLTELRAAPFSAAAEILLLPWVALVALGFAGLWPVHGWVYPMAAPLSGVILLRLGSDILPAGVEHWAPLFMPVLVLGAWHAALTIGKHVTTRRAVAMMVAAALFGVFAGGRGEEGAWWFLAIALVFPWAALIANYMQRMPLRLAWLSWLLPGYAGWLVLNGGLGRQVTWTVLLAVAAAVAVARGADSHLEPSSE